MLAQADTASAFEPYSCKIESLTKVEQKRSPVPAMDSIKRAFRSMFKRGRKSKQDEQRRSPAQQQPKSTTASPAKPPAAPTKDTERQQVKGLEPNTMGKLPPTHPPSTGRHDQPQSAIPLERAVQAPLPTDGGGADGVKKVGAEERLQPTMIPATTAQSEPVSAISRDEPPAPPPKTDGAADAVLAAPMEAAVAAPAVTESQPEHMQSTGEPMHEPVQDVQKAAKEVAQPNGIASTHTDSTSLRNHADLEDKIPVNAEEPPPMVKAVRAAPGMSATSGPLEDFPEGGNYVE
ncbi:hypothetical protein B0A55_03374 [Friedmanniomyces simplex]|uniref:Uncharacterized protein n=1 Tax=Friedmanniomyces simplex TaxID=329884 RepID=A0A4U0XVM6_9PEZI|nr:hypothetical protein B0A55_03374 [Friedmanniomyces simplex]